MRGFLAGGLWAVSMSLVLSLGAAAQGLRVSPVLLEVPAPGAATTMTLRNDGSRPITVQSRVFRWMQPGAEDSLQRSGDVVVSPPAIQLAPGATQTIRVVRTTRAQVQGEEAYRVILNEIPDQSRRQAGAVAFATELRIPAFFTDAAVRSADVRWSLRQSGGATHLVAQNTGDSRLRIADVTLTASNGATVSHPGLLGYVLGGSSMEWPIASAGQLGGSARLSAATNLGALDVDVAMR